MADRKGFNGLRNMAGGLPMIGQQLDRTSQAKAAIGALARDIYARAAAAVLVEAHGSDGPEALARGAMELSQGFFVAMGVIEMKEPDSKAAAGRESGEVTDAAGG